MTPEGWGVPPSPHPFGTPAEPPRDQRGDYKSARAVAQHLSQSICCQVKFCGCCSVIFFKMVDPRMRVEDGGLRSLENPINVHGLHNMDLGRPEERTRLDTNLVWPLAERSLDLTHLRRFRRVPLTQESVNSFVYKYCFVMDAEENCLYVGRRQKRVMHQMLVRQFLPWIRDNLIECLDDSRWPLEMILFKGLDDLLPCKFPKVHSGSCWQAIAQCYRRIQAMEGWVEESESEEEEQ